MHTTGPARARTTRPVGVGVVVGLAVCVALAGCRSAPGHDDTVSHSYQGVHRVVVDTGPGDVTLLRGTGDIVDVTVSRHWTGSAPEAAPVLTGDQLAVRSRCGEQSEGA